MNSDNITDIQVIFSLFNKIKKIKDNLKEYIGATLYDDKKSDKVKVIFSLRDEHIWDKELPRWRYWIGLDKNEINELAEPYLKDNLSLFWGHKDENINVDDPKNLKDIAPNVFFPKIDFSPQMQPGKNWFFTRIPKDLKPTSVGCNPFFIHHVNFEKNQFEYSHC